MCTSILIYVSTWMNNFYVSNIYQGFRGSFWLSFFSMFFCLPFCLWLGRLFILDIIYQIHLLKISSSSCRLLFDSLTGRSMAKALLSWFLRLVHCCGLGTHPSDPPTEVLSSGVGGGFRLDGVMGLFCTKSGLP